MDVNVVITGKNLGYKVYWNCLCLTWDSPTVWMFMHKKNVFLCRILLLYSIMWWYFEKMGIFCPRFIQQVIGLFWIVSSNRELEKYQIKIQIFSPSQFMKVKTCMIFFINTQYYYILYNTFHIDKRFSISSVIYSTLVCKVLCFNTVMVSVWLCM